MTTEYQQSFESLINSFEGKLTDADQELIQHYSWRAFRGSLSIFG
jgi:hypothetical protein